MSQIITSEVLGFAMFTSNVSFQGELKFPDSAQVADHCSLGIRINESTRGRYRNVFRRYQAIITNVNCQSDLIRGNSPVQTRGFTPISLHKFELNSILMIGKSTIKDKL